MAAQNPFFPMKNYSRGLARVVHLEASESLMSRHRVRLIAATFLVLALSYSGVAWAVLRCPMGGCGEASLSHHSDSTHQSSPKVHCGAGYYNIEPFVRFLSESRLSGSLKSVQLKSFLESSILSQEKLFWIRPFLDQPVSLYFLNSPPRYLSLSVLRI